MGAPDACWRGAVPLPNNVAGCSCVRRGVVWVEYQCRFCDRRPIHADRLAAGLCPPERVRLPSLGLEDAAAGRSIDEGLKPDLAILLYDTVQVGCGAKQRCLQSSAKFDFSHQGTEAQRYGATAHACLRLDSVHRQAFLRHRRPPYGFGFYSSWRLGVWSEAGVSGIHLLPTVCIGGRRA